MSIIKILVEIYTFQGCCQGVPCISLLFWYITCLQLPCRMKSCPMLCLEQRRLAKLVEYSVVYVGNIQQGFLSYLQLMWKKKIKRTSLRI